MELLAEIRNGIDRLKQKPGSVDLSDVVALLSQAHEVAQDGLERSHAAEMFRKIGPELEELKATHDETVQENTRLTEELAGATSENAALRSLLDATRRDTLGKLSLVKKYSDSRRKSLERDLLGENIAVVLSRREEVLEDFNQEWAGKPERMADSGEWIDFSLFKTGV